MVWALIGGLALFVLGWAGYGFYRLGRSRERETQARSVILEQENKDARRNDSMRAAGEFADLLQWQDDSGQGGPDAS